MKLRHRSITLRAIRYFWRQWRDELTPAGKIAVWGICVTGMGTVSVLMPIYQLFFGLVMLLSIAATAGYFFRPHVLILGDFPDHGTAGRPLTAAFTLKNLRRLPAYDVGLNFLGLPEVFETELDRDMIPRLGAGESAAISVTITPKRRGRYQLPDLRAYSTFPFYLGRSGKVSKSVAPLIVVPNFEPISMLALPTGSRYQPGGIALTSHVGESPEYIGNRDYVPGEPIRRLDFRAWARTGKPVVREYQEEYYCRVALVLDTFVAPNRRAGSRGFEDLEAAVSLTAAVAEFLSGGEHIIDLFAAGPELHVFRSGRHTAHFENVLEILAGVEPCRDDPFAKLGPAVSDELLRISTAVVVLLVWNESRRQLLDRITEAGCRLRTFLIVRDSRNSMVDPTEIPECTVLDVADLARGSLELR
ncbi:MAG: DUF58 domain-containing protein [Planctomycetaceae bacterium]|nr:DUF58 domain-containing protein [Planctomycetaceae bacterium]